MAQNVMITGTGRNYALGYNMVLRYLENGDYVIAKAALNMGTMNLVNVLKDDEKMNIFCVHPGWIRTDGKPDN